MFQNLWDEHNHINIIGIIDVDLVDWNKFVFTYFIMTLGLNFFFIPDSEFELFDMQPKIIEEISLSAIAI